MKRFLLCAGMLLSVGAGTTHAGHYEAERQLIIREMMVRINQVGLDAQRKLAANKYNDGLRILLWQGQECERIRAEARAKLRALQQRYYRAPAAPVPGNQPQWRMPGGYPNSPRPVAPARPDHRQYLIQLRTDKATRERLISFLERNLKDWKRRAANGSTLASLQVDSTTGDLAFRRTQLRRINDAINDIESRNGQYEPEGKQGQVGEVHFVRGAP